MSKTTLYAKDAKGKIRVWEIEPTSYGYDVTFGELGGEKQIKEVDVVPKANRDFDEQVDLEVKSQINKKIDTGYCYNLNSAMTKKRTNSMGTVRPMLAQTFNNGNQIEVSEIHVQHKYDGHRCLIANQGGKIIAYSRNGKPITTIHEIIDELQGIGLPEGLTLDGELYTHGKSLQHISSAVKRRQEGTTAIKYIAYDCVLLSSYGDRIARLRDVLPDKGKFVEIAPTYTLASLSEVEPMLDASIARGYEGLILRLGGYPYEDGKRSKSLIKVKRFLDSEFIVRDITESRDGWAILHCVADNGKDFTVSAPGNFNERMDAIKSKDRYIGRMVTVKYAMLTRDGIPFHPVAKNWRED